MSTLLSWTLANGVMACLLGLVAWLSRRWQRPALTHALWLLVLVKLVTPPLGTIPVPLPGIEPAAVAPGAAPAPAPDVAPPAPIAAVRPLPEAEPAASAWAAQLEVLGPFVEVDVGPEQHVCGTLPTLRRTEALPENAASRSELYLSVLGVAWLTGTVLWFAVVAVRLFHFQRLLKDARPAPEALQAQASALAARLDVACPELVVVPGAVSPLLWVWRRRARLVLPASLLQRLTEEQSATILAHELAHWRRGDHWVRRLEMLVLGFYWWNPLAWIARRRLHEAEEECCDAWVVATLPEAAKAYALALVETLDFLAGVPAALPVGASGVGQFPSLQRRFVMILSKRPERSLTVLGGMVLAAAVLALLPWIPSWAQEGERAEKKRPPEEKNRDFDGRGERPAPGNRDKFDEELRRAREELERAKKNLDDKLRESGRFGERPMPPGPPREGERPFGPGPRGDIEKRLTDLERKLDVLIWEMTNLRKEMGPRPFRPEGRPGEPQAPPQGGPKRTPPPGGERPDANSRRGDERPVPPPPPGEGRRIERPDAPPPPPTPRRLNKDDE
jgi:beta-lactamase regulating signal transducer with metallopeptidase domain